jgi:hypothetical protein
MIPGERITVAALADKALRSCSSNTARTYGTHMRFLAQGWPGQPRRRSLRRMSGAKGRSTSRR